MNVKRILKILFFAIIAISIPLVINQLIFYPIPPITIGEDSTKIDICQIIPMHNIEKVVGKLDTKPVRYNYNIVGASGCSYHVVSQGFHPDGGGPDIHTGYIVLTPADAYNNQPLNNNHYINDFGIGAYFNSTMDGYEQQRQLWVKVNSKVAFFVSFNDNESSPNEQSAKDIAKLLLAAIK